MQIWRLDQAKTTMILASDQQKLPQIVYLGTSLPKDQPLEMVVDAASMDVTGGMLDENPPLSICPQASDGFPGQAGLVAYDEKGAPLTPRFVFQAAHQKEDCLILDYCDEALGLDYQARFDCPKETGLFALSAKLSAKKSICLHRLSAPVLPASQMSQNMLDVSGRWIGEMQLNCVPWTMGSHLRESRTGRSGHENFPALLVPQQGCTNTKGSATGYVYCGSGGHYMLAEQVPDGRRQIQFGNVSASELHTGLCFETETLLVACSNRGLNGLGIAFQRYIRDYIQAGQNKIWPRPVHYNCWEALYFDHNMQDLQDIAEKAAALGAERFVLDDGWFGQRDDDTSSLGDWSVDARKYPQGLMPLIETVQDLGMGFGLWFEPEMVNEKSRLFETHPDWILGHREQIKGRQQWALNMALPQVQDYLYEAIAALLNSYPVDYIKWDHNRVLPICDYDQSRGTHALMKRLRADFPNTEIESCASGGGRMDYGMLAHTQRVWLSDSNDALERFAIQHNAALFLPAIVTGSHVGPRKCHTSGRVIPMEMRAWVAASRHMGFEMDPRELSEEEAHTLSTITQWWQDNRSWLMLADILRLDHQDPALLAEMHLSRSKERFVTFAAQMASSKQIVPRPLRLSGLQDKGLYKITLTNKQQAHHLSRGTPALKQGDLVLSGAFLMQQGLMLPWAFPQTIWVIEGTMI
ncbi:MAG: alpha-galactosidase [Cohaesibacter sp.]|nr:alpha-galactosidase [Cohaesibacter sp.]